MKKLKNSVEVVQRKDTESDFLELGAMETNFLSFAECEDMGLARIMDMQKHRRL